MPYFCRVKTDALMVQVQLNSLLDYLLHSLDYENRLWLSQHLIEPQTEATDISPLTWDEARERLANARNQFDKGRYSAHNDVIQKRKRASL